PTAMFFLPPVQRKVVRLATDYLSETLHTKVSVSSVYVGLFNRVYLHGVYVEDQAGDTLLSAGRLTLNHGGLYQLLARRWTIEHLSLSDARLHIHTPEDGGPPNYAFLQDFFFPPDSKGPDTSGGFDLRINLRHIRLADIDISLENEAAGNRYDIRLAGLEGQLDTFDLQGRVFAFQSITLQEPLVRIGLDAPKVVRPADTHAPVAPAAGAVAISDPRIRIRSFELENGCFSLRNLRREPVRTTPPDVLNYHYLDLDSIGLSVRDFSFGQGVFLGEVLGMHLRDSSGFVLEDLAVRSARVDDEEITLDGLRLITPHTRLGDTLHFQYPSFAAWSEFVDEVEMTARFHGATVAIQDILTFAPVLSNNSFFRENRSEVLEISGLVNGTVNHLDGRDLRLNLAKGVRMEGGFSSFNLAVPDEQFLSLKLNRLRTHMRTLRQLLPGFTPPENFQRLGRLDFSGKFDGFFVDFVADGRLLTDIGRAELFMNLKTREGKEKAEYSGTLRLKDFDLGKWSGNPDVGTVSLQADVRSGKGLTLNTVYAEVEGTVDSLLFRGYKYQHAFLNGLFRKNLFSGELSIEDENVNLAFGGSINLADSIPAFDFDADIRHLSLQALNIADRDLTLAGKLSLRLEGRQLADANGAADILDLCLVRNQSDTFRLDSASLRANLLPGTGEKELTFSSSLATMHMKGHFDLPVLPAVFRQFLVRHHPDFSERLGITAPPPLEDTVRFECLARLYDLRHLLHFVDERLDGFDGSRLTGRYNGPEQSLFLELEVPAFSYQQVAFGDIYLRSKLQGEEGSIQAGIVHTSIGEDQELPPAHVIGSLFRDTFEFLLISSNFYKVLDNVNINGVLTVDTDRTWRVSFKDSDLVLLNQQWKINTNNYIRFGKDLVQTRNFLLTSGTDQQIRASSIADRGLELQLNNYPLDSFDFLRNIPQHAFRGKLDVEAEVDDLFSFRGLSALVRIDSFQVNGDDYGRLRLDAFSNSTRESVNAYLSVTHDTMYLIANGYFNPPGLQADNRRRRDANGPLYFDFSVNIDAYPTRIVQYFVADVKDVRGSVSSDNIRIYGLPDQPMLSGEARVTGAAFQVNALRTTYRVPDGKVILTNNLFDGTGSMVYDRFNNSAVLEGGITHQHLRDFGLDLRISTPEGKGFVGLETTARDNPVFYGTAIGTGFVKFSGSFRQPSLYVKGRTLAGTHMYLPMTTTASSTPQSRFLVFPEKKSDAAASAPSVHPLELRGLNMEYDLDITPDAAMDVIFDKAWGDVMQGTGTSQLKVIMTREGRFDMYGQFTVATGEYLFTLMNLGLNKPFVVEPGGTITWNGNPYDATINVNAVYGGLNTSVYSFIQEYLAAASPAAQDLSRNGTNVQLKMNLSGQLLKPDIAFDIKFPNLDSELRNFAENKMRAIRQDPNELNRQVFGLLILGQFLPSGYTIQASDVGINTLSEMLSNQLSIYLTEFVSEFFAGSNLIKGIDLNISYNRYSAGGGATDPTNPTLAYTSNELQGRLNVIVNDRFSIRMGGNFDVSGGNNQLYTSNSGFLSGDFQLEYVITKDKRLKIKVYNSTEPDFAGGRRNKYGVGLSFRKEFDSLQELVDFRRGR
ncbi:MAG: hypothetical protein RLY31_3201, partial [Bacteroidota bacterium]